MHKFKENINSPAQDARQCLLIWKMLVIKWINKLWELVMDREAWHAVVHRVTKNQI